MKFKILTAVLATAMLISVLFSSLPLVHADYTVAWASFPPILPGDVNGDGKVDIRDVSIVAKAYGSKFGGPNWDPRADVNNDGKVDIKDVNAVAKLDGVVYNTSSTPTAYTASFEFDVPNTGVSGVWYYILTGIYLPSSLTSNTCFLVGNANAEILSVSIDASLIYPNPTSGGFNIQLGNVAQGFHVLYFEYLGPAGQGGINFHVQTSAGETVWLTRSRICVPNYNIPSPISYNVITNTYFPYFANNGNHYYLVGNTTGWLDSVACTGSQQSFPESMWSTGSVSGGIGLIYGWGDGFMYPMGGFTSSATQTITFNYHNNGNAAGLLDFYYVSPTNQSGEIGQPKFYASASPLSNLGQYVTVNSLSISGGSQWASTPVLETTERNFTALAAYNVSMNDGDYYNFTTLIEVSLGNWWATMGLSSNPGQGGPYYDMGIPINFTVANWNGFPPSNYPPDPNNPVTSCWELELNPYTIDIYSFDNLQIGVMENGQYQSKPYISSNYQMLENFAGTAIEDVIEWAIEGAFPVVGALVGLGVTGAMVAIDLSQGTRVSDYLTATYGNYHTQLTADHYPWIVGPDPNYLPQSQSDLVFMGLTANAPSHCGLTEVVLTGTVTAYWCSSIIPYPGWITFPIGNIQATLCIPWFILPLGGA